MFLERYQAVLHFAPLTRSHNFQFLCQVVPIERFIISSPQGRRLVKQPAVKVFFDGEHDY
jgi:hypothetical protein